jgi:hypothetical protein
MQNDLQAEIGRALRPYHIYFIVGAVWRRRFLRAIPREGARGMKGLLKEYLSSLEEVEIWMCEICANRT